MDDNDYEIMIVKNSALLGTISLVLGSLAKIISLRHPSRLRSSSCCCSYECSRGSCSCECIGFLGTILC